MHAAGLEKSQAQNAWNVHGVEDEADEGVAEGDIYILLKPSLSSPPPSYPLQAIILSRHHILCAALRLPSVRVPHVARVAGLGDELVLRLPFAPILCLAGVPRRVATSGAGQERSRRGGNGKTG